MGSRRPSRGCLLGAGPELRGTGWRLRESPWAEEAMVKDGMRMRISTREEGCRGRWGRARACAPPSEFEGHLTVNRTSLAAFWQVSSFKKLMPAIWRLNYVSVSLASGITLRRKAFSPGIGA